jgi:uncharacterized protein YabE (DUF348 family)
MKKLFFITLFFIGAYFFFFHDGGEERMFDTGAPKNVSVSVDGTAFRYSGIRAMTVGELFKEIGMEVVSGDRMFPEKDANIFSGMTLFVEREKKISIKADGETKESVMYRRTVAEAFEEMGISVKEEDIVKPEREMVLDREMKISVTRVEIREETVEKKIAFETVEKEDDELSFRKRIVTQKGESGVRSYRYRVSYHDGKEVGRKLLGNEITKEPVKEVVTQGTYVKTGKSHRGAASWYAWTGTMAAANPWLPMGSYVKVTNMENGKSVIVKINDRGPFVPGRIIDLDKVAFQKIASIGAGVINVKMEEVIN